MRAEVILGDCLSVMRTMPAMSVDAVVTDPPYGLAFMGKLWDHGVPGVDFWAEALRVAKPGAALLAFGGTRTFHRLACAIEDGGWEIRDCLAWLYGSGFPKSLDVSKAIDKAAGAKREVVGVSTHSANRHADMGFHGGSPNEGIRAITAPATEAAREWSGWGTALKPAYEPVILARKPLKGTVAANVLRYRTGALNVEGCRLQTSGPTATIGEWEQDGNLCASCASDAGKRVRPSTPGIGGSTAPRSAAPTRNAAEQTARDGIDRTATGCSAGRSPEAQSGSLAGPSNSSTARSGRTPSDLFPMDSSSTMRTATGSTTVPRTCASCGEPTTSPSTLLGTPTGRWPSNVLLDEEAARMLDEQSGNRPGAVSNGSKTTEGLAGTGTFKIHAREQQPGRADSGGASRFFYTAKASRADREDGLEGVEERTKRILNGGIPSAVNSDARGMAGGGDRVARNHHPTVKPTDLMRWLCRLVTPPGGTVLDPFAGSGSTGVAALSEGFDFIGIEREADYVEIARRRIANVAPLFAQGGAA